MGNATDERHMIFDSACHEGNYGLTGILSGAPGKNKPRKSKGHRQSRRTVSTSSTRVTTRNFRDQPTPDRILADSGLADE